jgi:hypothetical protein
MMHCFIEEEIFMLKALTAYTGEIEDVEAAVSEILEQLDKDALLENSIGFVTCYEEFIESGVVKALCEALPFEVVGATTTGSAVQGSKGMMLLTLMVLTGDDVSFAVGLTEPLAAEDEAPLRAGYQSTLAKVNGKPSLMLTFAPLLMNIGGNFYVETFSAVSGGVPNFGMLAVDLDNGYRKSKVICNGEAYHDRCTMVLLTGKLYPGFFTGSISTEKILREKGLVTASNGNQLQTINGKPATDYLREIGFTSDAKGMIAGIEMFPFIVDYNDGTTPVMRAIFSQTPEGYAICGGDVPVGSTLSIGSMDAEEVSATSAKALSSALADRNAHCVLLFSCVGRYLALGYNPTSEVDTLQKIMEGTGIPYQFAYSGGEICPVYEKQRSDDSTKNRFHNDTLGICVL